VLAFGDNPADTGTVISASAGLETGQIVKGNIANSNYAAPIVVNKGWQERFVYRLKYDIEPVERIRMLVDIEGQISFSYPQYLNPIETQTSRNLFFLEQAQGTYTLGDKNNPYLQFGVGYFPYKFDPDAKNLGEVIFRSGTYPLWIITDFDHCYGKLLGFRVSSTLLGSLKQDLMLTSEAQMFPTQDFSISYAAHYTAAKMFDIGAAISFAHLFSTEGKFTSPKTDLNNLYIQANGDTSYYSFRGIKPSAVIAFDSKQLFPEEVQSLMGKDDGRLYGEVCVSGWQNYRNYDTSVTNDTTKQMLQYYANRADRTVWMIGFNIPVFKVLDVLSLEVEHFPNRYPNSYRNVIENTQPLPLVVALPKAAEWKCSLYAKKTVLKKFSIVGQIARDHMRPAFTDLKNSEKEDVLRYYGDWWWNLAFRFAI
jgi:hypothetical protein